MPHTEFNPSSTTPLISFIVPVYNMPVEYITECIDSILQLPLGHDEREIILIDDGSDIPVNGLIPQYSDDIIYLRQENKGQSAARNAGMDTARGEYIQFVDSDDSLMHDAYSKIIAAVKSQSVEIIYFRFSYTNANADKTYQFSSPIDGRTLLLTQYLRAADWGYLFKRSTLGDLRFPPHLLHEDEEFTPLLFLKAKSIVCTDLPAYYYRQRTGSTVNTINPTHLNRRFENIETVLEHLRERAEEMEGSGRHALQRRIAHLTIEYLYNIARLTKSNDTMEKTMQRLRRNGFYPVPNLHLGARYVAMRMVFSYKPGRILAIKLLPFIKP